MRSYLAFLVLLFSLLPEAKGQEYFFRQFNNEDGLHHPFIYSINQDNYGFMWIGTAEGLYEFNGFDFKYFTSEDGLAENFITNIFKDKSGKMWFGHQNGSISVLKNKEFFSISNGLQAKGLVTDFTEDNNGLIWATVQNQGLILIQNDTIATSVNFSIKDEQLSQIEFLYDDHFLIGSQENLYLTKFDGNQGMILIEKIDSYPGSKISDIVQVSSGNYVIISQAGGISLIKFEPTSKDYTFSIIDDNADGLLDNLESGIVDANGTIWLCSMGNGLLKYKSLDDGQYVKEDRISTENGLISDNARTVFKDFEGNLWFGIYGDGLLKYVDNNLTFYNYSQENVASSIFSVSGNDSILLAIDNNNLLKLNHSGNKVLGIYPLPEKRPSDHVNSVYMDNEGFIWLGYEDSGLFVSKTSDYRFIPVYISDDNLANSVNHITGKNGIIWVATDRGVCRIIKKSGETRWFTTNEGLPYNNIHQVFIDSKNRTLIATTCSEIHFINGKGEVARLENSQIYPINDIVAFFEDSNYRIWAGTLGNGIWMIDKEENVNYNKSSGLISNYCYSISSSEKGEILIGHRGGLSQIDPETARIKIFGYSEGIKTSTDFYTNSNYSDSFGNSWFGTSQGLLKYSPGIYLGGTMEPRLKITGLFLDGKELDWTGGKITLKPGQYEIKVEYIGINLTNPALVRYQTYLEGYSKNWSDLTLKRSVIYDRVDYGNYLFKIKAFNENNIGGEISSFFEVSIKKPVYLSIWFYAILAILIGSGFYTLLKWRERNLKRVQERLIKNLDEKTKDIIVKEEIIKERKKVEKELIEAKTKVELSDKLKTSFLNNMSHEIRTPMNAIVGFSQILMNVGGTEAEQKEYLDRINQNAESLLTLIDDIIDLSRLETGQLNINNDSCNPNALILELQAKYQEILDNQGKNKIQLTTDIPGKTDLNITTDTNRLNQIMTKLLDNAVKFTESGSIRFGYSLKKDKISFYVKDTGIGLSKDKMEVVFDLFRKIEDDNLVLYRGTGLGLTLSKYLVKLLGGEINVDSKENEGSKFYFEFPVKTQTGHIKKVEPDGADNEYNGAFQGKRILHIEDNDFSHLLIDHILMPTDISIERAEDGLVGLEKYFSDGAFDIILMDMSLPNMDGYETTREIRKKDKDVPIISYTANPKESDHKKAMEAGCNVFLEKPSERLSLLKAIESYLVNNNT